MNRIRSEKPARMEGIAESAKRKTDFVSAEREKAGTLKGGQRTLGPLVRA